MFLESTLFMMIANNDIDKEITPEMEILHYKMKFTEKWKFRLKWWRHSISDYATK